MTQPRKLRKFSWPEIESWRSLIETEIESQMANELWSKLFDISHGPGGMYQIIGDSSSAYRRRLKEILKPRKRKRLTKENNNIPDVLDYELNRKLDSPTWSETWSLLITQSQIPKPQDNIMETLKTRLDDQK